MSTTGEELRTNVSTFITLARWGSVHHDEVAKEMLRAIVEALGVTAWSSELVRRAADDVWSEEHCIELHRTADALTTLLDAAEGS